MRITLIDDEKILAETLRKKLLKIGHSSIIFDSVKDFFSYKDKQISDLYIIDISLPDGNGIDIVNFLRNELKINTPIIILSGHEKTELKIQSLETGADDYMTKPFSFDELAARIKAVTRRKNSEIEEEKNSELVYKNISLNKRNYIVLKNGVSLKLTKKEKQLLEFFLLNKNKLISKQKLIDAFWWQKKNKKSLPENIINVTICNLRKKMGENFLLLTKNREGYILEE